MAWPPMRFHSSFGASATCSIVMAPACAAAAQVATPRSEPCTDTTTDFVAASTYQPVTVLGRLAAAVLSELTAAAGSAGVVGAAFAGADMVRAAPAARRAAPSSLGRVSCLIRISPSYAP